MNKPTYKFTPPKLAPVRTGPSETEKVRAYFAERLAFSLVISGPAGTARVVR